MLILFAKSQLGLFDMPVIVAGSVRKDGTIVKPHVGIRKKKLEAPKQADLFGGGEKPDLKTRRRVALDAFLRKHGGLERLAGLIRGMTEGQQQTLFESMGKLSGQSVPEVAAMFDDVKPDTAQPDMFAQPAPVESAGPVAQEALKDAASGEKFVAPPKLDLPTVDLDGDTWHILNTGHVREDGKVLAHLSSATRGRSAKNGVQPVQRQDYIALPAPKKSAPDLIEYTTKKGKVLRGVVRSDLDQWGAKEIDPYSFRINGGWFIREKYLGGDAPAAEPASPAPAQKRSAGKKPAAPVVNDSLTTAPRDDASLPFGVPAGTSKADRRRLNAAAAALVAEKTPGEMTDSDRAVLRQYSGNGGCGDSLNEFYTDPAIAASIWSVVNRLGIESGTALEPSCGTGVFLHTAPAGFKVTGVELDPVSSQIATALHGDRHEIQNASLERFATQDMRQFNVVVGNPPYGPRGMLAKDDKVELSKAEEYFIDTSLDKTLPGGLCVLVVPAGIMDSKNGRGFRERVLRKAEFLGAQRMPNTAFEHTHTDVTADILYFRKRADDVAGALGTVDQDTLKNLGVWDDEFLSGGYFEGRGAGNLFGTVGTAKRAFGEIYTVTGSMAGVPDEVANFIPHPEGANPSVPDILDALGDDEAAKARALAAAEKRPYQDTARVGDTRVIDGVSYVLMGTPPRWHRTDEALQSEEVTEGQALAAEIETLMNGSGAVDRPELEKRVRAWVEKFGMPSKNPNLLVAAATDKSLYRLIGAVGKDGEISDVVAGRISVEADKERGFDTIARAIALTDEGGHFTVDELAKRLGQDREEVLDRLVADTNYAYIPDASLGAAGAWAPLDVYLTGELWPKLDAARAALAREDFPAELRDKLEHQARRLDETIDPKSLEDVEIALNTGFIPLGVIEAWINAKTAELREQYPSSSWYKQLSDAKITFADGVYSINENLPINSGLLSKYLNRTGVRKDDLPTIDEWNEQFKDWLCASSMRDEVEDLYNRKFRGYVLRDFSNEPIDVPGLNPDMTVRDWRWSSLRKSLALGKGIIADDVGLGKTLGGLLLARMAKINGQAKKPIIVVPKSVLANWYAESQKWFPGSRVLTIGAEFGEKDGQMTGRDDSAAERKRKYHALSQNDYDFVVISEPAFEELDLDPIAKEEYYSRDFWVQRGEKLGNAGDKRRKKIREQYEQAIAQREFKDRTDAIYFNEIGADMIVADEMHHCFPAGTLIDGIPVESLKAGDVIKSFNHDTGEVELRPVVDVAAMRANLLCRVTLSNGQSIVSTDNHRFFTLQAGYVEAASLSDSFDVIVENTSTSEEKNETTGQDCRVHALREYLHYEWRAAVEGGHWARNGVLLQQELRGEVESKAARGAGLAADTGNQEEAQRGAKGVQLASDAGITRQKDGSTEVDAADKPERPASAGRERSPATCSTRAACACSRLADGAHLPYSDAEMEWVSVALQDRYCECGNDGCDRSGRREPQLDGEEGAGPAERGVLVVARVVRVEILEPGSDGEFERLCPEGLVYDIEVAGNHNFFAEGVLVHNSKNLYAAKARFGDSPKFLGGQGLSNRALDFNLKARWLLDHNAGKNVYGLTATPTKNSPLEIYSMLSHIAPEAFENIGVRNSEEFLDRFCLFERDNVLGTDGSIEDALVTAGFKNMGELREIMARYIDRRTADEVGLVLPERDDRMHMVDMSTKQQEVYADLRAQLEESGKKKDATGDSHIFSIMDKMNKAALDLALLSDEHASEKSPKYAEVAKQVAAGVQDGGQVVFADYIGAHEKIADALVAKGIPRNQIAIINAQVAGSAVKRQNIADAFNAGKIKVVIGNTATMGEGMNLQMGTTDIHHLDLPWEPASMQQRNGRGLRQGNTSEAVRIHSYLSRGSFDGYRYQAISAKKDWQDLLWNGGDRVDNLAREGKFSRDELLIMMSADPDEARKKLEADKGAAMQKFEAGERVKAAEEFVRFQELKAGYRALKNKGTAAATRLHARIESAKTGLKANRFFTAKAALDSDEAVVIQPATGLPLHKGVAFSAVGEDGADEGRFVVMGVSPRLGTVTVRKYADPSSKPKAVKVENLAHGITPFAFDADAEAKEVADSMARAPADKLNNIDSWDTVMSMPPAVLKEAHDSIQAQLKDGAKSYKVRFPHDRVPMINRETGEIKMAESYEHGRMHDTHDYLLPTEENKRRVEQAWMDEERNATFGTGTVTSGRRGNLKYNSVAEKQYPGAPYTDKKRNPWSRLVSEHAGAKEPGYGSGGSSAVRALRIKFNAEQMKRVRQAKTMDEAIAAAAPMGHVTSESLGNSASVVWNKRALAMLWAKARQLGVLDKPIDEHTPKKASSSGFRSDVHSGYAYGNSRGKTVHDALVRMARHSGYADLSSAMVTSGEKHQTPEAALETMKAITAGYSLSANELRAAMRLAERAGVADKTLRELDFRDGFLQNRQYSPNQNTKVRDIINEHIGYAEKKAAA